MPGGENSVRNLLYMICKEPSECDFAGFFGVDKRNMVVSSFSNHSSLPRKVHRLHHVVLGGGERWMRLFCRCREENNGCDDGVSPNTFSYYISPLLTDDIKWERHGHACDVDCK